MGSRNYYSLMLVVVLLGAVKTTVQKSASQMYTNKQNCYQMYKECLHPQHGGKEYERFETVNYSTISAFCDQHKHYIATCLAEKMQFSAPPDHRYKVFSECSKSLKSSHPSEKINARAEHHMRIVARLSDYACTYSNLGDLHKPPCFNYMWDNCIAQKPNRTVCNKKGVFCPQIQKEYKMIADDEDVTFKPSAATRHTCCIPLVFLFIALLH